MAVSWASRLRRQAGAARDVHLQPLPVRDARGRGLTGWRTTTCPRAWRLSASTATMRRPPARFARANGSRSRGARVSVPLFYDETQEVAKAYGEACTPDFFLYDKSENSSIAANSMAAGRAITFRSLARPACGTRGRARRQHPPREADSQHRLQHQVARGQ